MSNVDKDLIENEAKRLKLRSEYRESMIGHAKLGKMNIPGNYIFFPQTVVDANDEQLRMGLPWLYNGFVIKNGADVIAVDPGVGYVLRLAKTGFDINSINAVFVSHQHIDHSADANLLMEWTVRSRSATKVLAPASVFSSKTVSDFHSGKITRFPVNHSSLEITSKSQIALQDTDIAFVELFHGVECYGFKLKGDKVVTYISDTGYAKELGYNNGKNIDIREVTDSVPGARVTRFHEEIKNFVAGSDVLVVNIDSYLHGKNSATHMSVMDLLHLLQGSNVKEVIIAHVNPVGELDYEDWGAKIATYVQDVTGCKTYAPGPRGLVVEL